MYEEDVITIYLNYTDLNGELVPWYKLVTCRCTSTIYAEGMLAYWKHYKFKYDPNRACLCSRVSRPKVKLGVMS